MTCMGTRSYCHCCNPTQNVKKNWIGCSACTSCFGLRTVSGLQELKSFFQGHDSKRFLMSVSVFLFRGNYSSCVVWIIMERLISHWGENSEYWRVWVTTIYSDFFDNIYVISLTIFNRHFIPFVDYIILILKFFKKICQNPILN